ncbi:MAG: hypothetical protein QME16_00060 [Planctomycetota bacterium]|nr:hypothetical protein [Planctomycetota bacterium]
MKTLIIFLSLTSIAYAGQIKYCKPDGKNCQDIVYNDKYSFKDFTGRILLDVDIAELEGTTIIGSCFSQELPIEVAKGRVEVFPKGLKNITLINCNLDNVEIKKPDWVIIGCSERNFKAQKKGDGSDDGDWLISEMGIKVKRINE